MLRGCRRLGVYTFSRRWGCYKRGKCAARLISYILGEKNQLVPLLLARLWGSYFSFQKTPNYCIPRLLNAHALLAGEIGKERRKSHVFPSSASKPRNNKNRAAEWVDGKPWDFSKVSSRR